MKKAILIICNSDLSREPRVIRQIVALKEDYKVCTLGIQSSGIDGVEHINFDDTCKQPDHWHYPYFIRKAYSAGLKLYGQFKFFYLDAYFERDYWTKYRRELLAILAKKNFDVIITHHWDTLPLTIALAAKGHAKVIFNAHDYYPRQFEKNEAWAKHQQRIVERVMQKYVPKCNLIFSAWTKIHDDFQKFYGIPSIIINNATEYNDLKPQLKDNGDLKIRIIHHGIANSNRKIEKMIEMMSYLNHRFYLDLMVIPSPHEKDYFNMLKEIASTNRRIRFIDPVPTREIAKYINGYDIGLFILPPNGFNPTYTLPNKSFEFIQGRLASLVTPNIEMKALVENYDLGWVSKDFEPSSVASMIANVTTEEINKKKQNAHKYAYELAAESNYKKIKECVQTIINQN